MKQIVWLFVALALFAGCASSKIGTLDGWKDIPDEKVWVAFSNKTPYTLRGKVIQDGLIMNRVQVRKLISADSTILVQLVRDRKYRIEGEAFDAKGKHTGFFVQFFATTNLKILPTGEITLEPVIISGADFYSSGAPPLFGFIQNNRPDSLIIRVWHPQRPGVHFDLSYGGVCYLTITF